jgi:hypothetical protein
MKFSAKTGDKVRVYIRNKAFLEGDRLYFTGTVKEIGIPERVSDKRFKNGFVVLRGDFIDFKPFRRRDYRKIAFDDITRIVKEPS